MRRRLFILVAMFAITLVVLGLPQRHALAYADATSTNFGCSAFSASGTTDAPYVTIYAYSYATGDEWFTIITPSGGTYSGSVSYPTQADGTAMNFQVWGSLAIYTDFSDPDYWDDGAFFNFDANCTGVSGPPIPAGWVQRTITCDVAVFDAPAGSPVGDNRLKAGQVFYVNPTTKAAADGTSWSQVFVSSYTSPWIPTRCVS